MDYWLEIGLFAMFGLGAVGTSALVVVPKTGKHPLYAALALVLSFFFIAGLYVMLLAHTMAVLQVLVYAGAIMVLFMFVIMLLNLSDRELGSEKITTAKLIGMAALGFVTAKLAVIAAVGGDQVLPTKAPIKASFGTLEQIGDIMFRQYLFPFEMTAILLLIAVIGAVVLAKRTL